MNSVTEFVRALGPARLAAIGAVAVALIGFFVFLMMRFSQPQMGVLFTELAFEDSIDVVRKLEGMNEPHEVRQNGAIIMAPRERVLRLRMMLAEDGLPAGGAVGYEIFDKGDTLGATSFVQNINKLRAIEGELARSIRTISRVKTARVHLVLPQRRLFGTATAKASASIVVNIRGGLDSGQIRAIQHLVASAVPELKPQRVSIVDESGKLLASGQDDEQSNTASSLDERSQSYEKRLQREIEEIVVSVVGNDRTRVRVRAELDYNRITQTSDLYDPEGQVIRSTQTREESSTSSSPNSTNAVSVGNELPSANAGDSANGNDAENAEKTEEIVNYEISKTTKTQIIEAGRLKRLSVAVLVDGIYTKDAAGALVYGPRSQEQLDKISALVKSAVGFDQSRGDQVHVTNLRFADNSLSSNAESQEEGFFTFNKADYFHIAELVVLFIVSLLVLLVIVRPLVRRIITPDESAAQRALTGGNPHDPALLTGPDGASLSADQQAAMIEGPKPKSATSEMLHKARITGEVHATAVREVGEVVENNPEEAMTIVREWIQSTA